MPGDVYRDLLRLCALLFCLLLPATQWAAFRELARRGAHEELLRSRNVRDHVLAALGPAALTGLALQIPAIAVWMAALWGRLRWDTLIGAEILLSFVVLAMGLHAAAMRFGLELMGRVERASASKALLGLRLFTLGVGVSYAATLWLLLPGGAGEALLSVFVLGVALIALGLNRTAEMEPELLRRLAEAYRRF